LNDFIELIWKGRGKGYQTSSQVPGPDPDG